MDVSPVGEGDITSPDFSYAHPPYLYPSSFSTGTTYTLTAVPNTADGYAFHYWTVNSLTLCRGETIGSYTSPENPITVAIGSESKYVTANFINLADSPTLYFPHVSTKSGWQTEIALINTSPDQKIIAILRAMNDDGQLVETKYVTVAARGRWEMNVADEFQNHSSIGYIVCNTDIPALQGYTKFYREGADRAAIPAVTEVNTSDIYIPHIASNDTFWTGISLVNTTAEAKNPTLTFDDGQSATLSLAAGEHKVFTIASLFDGQQQPGIKSGVITNASGIIGLELFGSDNQLDGILLTDHLDATLYYPHVADITKWWTGIVAYNPAGATCQITISPFSENGTALPASFLQIGPNEKYVGVVKDLSLPDQTAWFKIDATQPLSGFELFGTLDGSQLAAYAEGSGAGAVRKGVFPNIEKSGWTGIALVNTESGAASVTLTAYNNNGVLLGVQTISVDAFAKVVNRAEDIFAPQSIASATHIEYISDKNVIGFQLNGSTDGTMLDGLPALD